MDKLIEVLASKRILTLVLIFFIAFAFLPSYFLIFIWNRSLLITLNIWKLLLLSASISTIFIFFNFLTIYYLDEVYILLTGTECGFLDTAEDVGKRYIGYYLLSLVLVVLEIMALVTIKCVLPNTTIEEMYKSGLGIVIVGSGICFILKIITCFKKRKQQKE